MKRGVRQGMATRFPVEAEFGVLFVGWSVRFGLAGVGVDEFTLEAFRLEGREWGQPLLLSWLFCSLDVGYVVW